MKFDIAHEDGFVGIHIHSAIINGKGVIRLDKEKWVIAIRGDTIRIFPKEK
jgi:hypothetical protein